MTRVTRKDARMRGKEERRAPTLTRLSEIPPMKETNRALIGTSRANRQNRLLTAAALTAKTFAISLFARSFDYSTFVRAREKKKRGWRTGKGSGRWRADAAVFFLVNRFARQRETRETNAGAGREGRARRGVFDGVGVFFALRASQPHHASVHIPRYPHPWPPRARSLGAERATRRSNGRRIRLLRLLRLGRFLLLLRRRRAAALGRGLGLGLVR